MINSTAKGYASMSSRNTLYLFAALLLLGGSLIAADDDPFAGTWKLNVGKSVYSGAPKPKEENLVVTDQGDNRLLAFTGTRADGSPIKMEIVEPKNGGPVQMTGAPPNAAWDTVVLKVINPATQEMIYTKDGKKVGVRHIKLASTHETLTARFSGSNAQGKKIEQDDVWEKQ